jgi:transcription initiation factor TFIID TATA-box-binding protein
MLRPIIQNIVCTANVGSTLYLPGLARVLHGCEYNAKRFSAVTFRLREPKTTALFFGSGKIVCTGAKTKNDARLALMKYVNIIRKRTKLDVNVFDFDIQNVVASANVGFPISLEKVCVNYRKESSYEPELFPGLIFRKRHLTVVFLIFLSGKLVITGAKDPSEIKAAFNTIVPILLTCKSKEYSDEDANQICGKTIRKIIPESQIDWSIIDLDVNLFDFEDI